MQKTSPSALARNLSIDALRGIAALMVVLYHCHDILWVGIPNLWQAHGFHDLNLNTILAYLLSPLFTLVHYMGRFGVAIFFVVSGYCIHRPNINRLLANPNHRLDLVDYIKRRLWRIYPVLIFALILTAIIDHYRLQFAPTLGPGIDAPAVTPIGDFRTFLINLFALQGTAGKHTPIFGSNGPLWTLSIEIHFYLLYPFLYYTTKKDGPKRLFLGIMVLSALSTLAFTFLPFFHGEPPIFLPYWSTWMLGFLLAEIEAGRIQFPRAPRWFPWPLIAASSLILAGALDDLDVPWFDHFFWGIGSVWIVYWSLGQTGIAFWDKPPGPLMARVGLFSYSLYACHIPLLWFISRALLGSKRIESLWILVLGLVVSIITGMIAYWLVERWSLKLPAFLQTKRPAAVPQ